MRENIFIELKALRIIFFKTTFTFYSNAKCPELIIFLLVCKVEHSLTGFFLSLFFALPKLSKNPITKVTKLDLSLLLKLVDPLLSLTILICSICARKIKLGQKLSLKENLKICVVSNYVKKLYTKGNL